MLIASLVHSTGRTASLSFTNGFFLCGDLLVVRLAREMSVTFGIGYSDVGYNARMPRHTVGTRLDADVCDNSLHDLLHTLHNLLRHRARYIDDHVIVSFDIKKEYINFLGESTSYTPESFLGI